MELIGRVLWWSDKNENGIIIDPTGNEFYFDRSVLKLKPRLCLRFLNNNAYLDCNCATFFCNSLQTSSLLYTHSFGS